VSSPSLLSHVRNYATAGVVSAIVGVISFPLMTRHLSVDDYGIIGLITASTTLAVAFGKLGIQHAIVRYYAESMLDKRGQNLLSFNTTVFTLFAGLSTIVFLLWLGLGNLIIPRFIDNPGIASYFTIVSLFIVLRMVGSVNWNLLRARQQSQHVSRSTIIGRCSYLALALLLLATDQFNLYFLLAAFVLAEAAAVCYASYAYRPHFSFQFSEYSTQLTGRLLRFGLPLMVLESLTLLLRLIDRYMIGSFLDEKQLGLYAASYNLSSYIEIVITASLAAAIRPMYTQIWEADGENATRSFLSNGPSDRYQSGTSIIPYIATMILIDGALIFLSAGQYFIGSTNTILFWGIVAGIVNLFGNYFMIPRFGIEGAAATTLFAFLVFASGVLNRSLRLLMFDISWKRPLLMLCFSLAVFFILDFIELASALHNVIVKGSLGGGLLLALLLGFDVQVRQWSHRTIWQKFIRRS